MLDTYNIPTLFVTITFNERWEPYTRILAHGRQDAGIPSDRPWEAVQYYYERLYWLKKRFLRNPELSRYGALKEIVQRQEFQLRGAIHSHCLLWCGKSTRDLIEQSYVRADLPDPEAEPLLHSLVQKYQIHTCRDDICGGPQAPTGQCRKGFPAPLAAATSQVTGQLRYTYQRLTEADRYVVPYNAELLLFWDGHCNVQYCTSTGLAKYISKYVTKSEPNSLVNVHSQDHVTSHILARRMGSMEVMVMALGHPIFQMSSGSMYLPTALPGMRNSTVRPPWEVEDDPENPYYHDAIEKYFARPQVNDIIESTYFLYYTNYQVSKKRIRNTSGWRNGWQDSNGYWIYKRAKVRIYICPFISSFSYPLILYEAYSDPLKLPAALRRRCFFLC
jgi:hypothetical protein